MKLDDGRLTFVAQQEVTALDAIHKAVLGKAACAGRMTEGVGTCISIHAPTWGATSFIFPGLRSTFNFNPRTHVGCDITAFRFTPNIWNFNPRTHVGCDQLMRLRNTINGRFQSTHPRGVRLPLHCQQKRTTPFQSTHPRGVRLTVRACSAALSNFNPRTHVGCDSVRTMAMTPIRYFNPRTHVGCDSL